MSACLSVYTSLRPLSTCSCRLLCAVAEMQRVSIGCSRTFPLHFTLTQATLQQLNTERICKLHQKASDLGESQVQVFLHYYIEEQTAAEDETDEWMCKAKAYGAMPGLFWHLDIEMKKHAKVGASPPALNHAELYL